MVLQLLKFLPWKNAGPNLQTLTFFFYCYLPTYSPKIPKSPKKDEKKTYSTNYNYNQPKKNKWNKTNQPSE